MTNENNKQIIVSVPGEWAVKKLLGPALNEIGKDLKALYKIGRDKIIVAATRKVNLEDGQRANLRVARDVFFNGSFTDEAICAEYFGGILAASRSEDGKNDSGVFYVDIIKSMSSGQLKMHYIIYRTLNKELVANEQKKTLNPGMESELHREKLFFPLIKIIEQFRNEDMGSILHGLHAKNLIGSFQTQNYKLENNKEMSYFEVQPTPLGIQLFAIANNMFSDWLKFSVVDFGDFDEVVLPKYYAQSLDSLLEKVGLKKHEQKP